MTEEIRPICLYVETCLDRKEGTRDCAKCEHHLSYWTEVMIRDMGKNINRLEQENKSLYEEKNCLHKIIDRLLENAGYSKDIASAEDFEDVYEDMQRKINEFAELEQENKELKLDVLKWQKAFSRQYQINENKGYSKAEENYRSALEEIKQMILNHSDARISPANCLLDISSKINKTLYN